MADVGLPQACKITRYLIRYQLPEFSCSLHKILLSLLLFKYCICTYDFISVCMFVLSLTIMQWCAFYSLNKHYIGTAIRQAQAVTEDIFIWTVRPRHSAVWTYY